VKLEIVKMGTTKEQEQTAEALYQFVTGYRYHGAMVHDPVKPESAKKRLMQLVEKYNIQFADIQALLVPEHFGTACRCDR